MQRPFQISIQWIVERGFTLIELLVTLVVLAIITTIALPSFQSIIQTNQARAELADFASYLQAARAEAIREGQIITVCGSTNGTACSGTADVWEKGWIIFTDTNGNQSVDVGETVLKVGQSFSTTDTLRSNASLKGLSFNREGFALGLNGNTIFTLHTQPVNSAATRCLLLNLVGRIQVQTNSANPGTCS